MMRKHLEELWNRLQSKRTHSKNFLTGISLKEIRGIKDLRIEFNYPVSVIAGPNACGKSTVLFAAACAYKVPGAGVKDFVPSTLFPDYLPKITQNGVRKDRKSAVNLEFFYKTPDGTLSMRWKRSKSWNRSFFGRRDAEQPLRKVYLRTLSNLSNPSEVRSVLRMSNSRTPPQETPLTAAQIEFAQRLLPIQYSEVVDLTADRRDKKLLFAQQANGAAYSEMHMAAGERSVLRLSQEIAQLKDALVLIDEVEAGLHPMLQQLLMLQLQQLALRNDLQIIVTTHSPVVLDSVPPYGRLFLDRQEDGEVIVQPPFRDIVQNALYGRSTEVLNLLCEDDAAEGLIRGVLDHLVVEKGIHHETVRIGRDTGISEFPAHVKAFKKFHLLEHFILVLDGDSSEEEKIRNKIQDAAGNNNVPVLSLPGKSPESWVWARLRTLDSPESIGLGISGDKLQKTMDTLDSTYDFAQDKQSDIFKAKLGGLGETLKRETPEICRLVGLHEAKQPESEIQPLADNLMDCLLKWRELA